jgi:hypothetical protein
VHCIVAKISDELESFEMLSRIESVQECDATGDAIIFFSLADKNKT